VGVIIFLQSAGRISIKGFLFFRTCRTFVNHLTRGLRAITRSLGKGSTMPKVKVDDIDWVEEAEVEFINLFDVDII
jgi:hypothetical protein